MFYLKTGTYLYYLVVNAETHLIGTGEYPQDDPSDPTPYLEALNSAFLYVPNWEAVGALTLLEFREDNNTARYYTPADVFYVFKKKMKGDAWQEARRRYPATSFEYNEMPDGNFPDITRTFTFERGEDGRWREKDVPVQRAMYSSVEEDFSQEILKLASFLRDACGEDGECSCEGSCVCGGGEDDTKEGCGCDSKPETPESNWYDEGETSSSNWYEDDSKEAGESELDDDDDEVVEALKKKTQKSRFVQYKQRRKKLRSDPAYRRKRQRQQKRQRRKPQHKQKQKRYRKRTKNSPRSRRRSPRKF